MCKGWNVHSHRNEASDTAPQGRSHLHEAAATCTYVLFLSKGRGLFHGLAESPANCVTKPTAGVRLHSLGLKGCRVQRVQGTLGPWSSLC